MKKYNLKSWYKSGAPGVWMSGGVIVSDGPCCSSCRLEPSQDGVASSTTNQSTRPGGPIKLEASARAVLRAAGRSEADIDWLIPHQANIRIMQGTARKLKLPPEKLVATVDTHGNTSAASIPLALDVADLTGDSVPDLLNASLVLGPTPSMTETAAATEIAGRLGFETMALDLPLARGVADSAMAIVVGRSGLAASGLATPGVDPTSLDSGEGAVAIQIANDRTWVLVLGGDDAGLLAGARLLAGVLPHTRTLSAPRLDSSSTASGSRCVWIAIVTPAGSGRARTPAARRPGW